MKAKQSNLILGVVLILLGGLFLVQTLGLIPNLAPVIWAAVFGAASLLFLSVYAASGWQQWGWLFPAAALGGVALAILLSTAGVTGSLVGAIFMWSISLPFWIVYLVNRQGNWWALIPGWATAVIGLVAFLSEWAAGELLGAIVMLGIGLPFFVVYLIDRTHWWALIPGFVMSGIGFALLLFSGRNDELIGAFILLAIALPFFVIYLRRKEHWWALIPAGVMTTLSVIVLFSSAPLSEGWQARLIAGVLFVGLAIPFAILWRQSDRHPTAWARYPAAVLALLALLALLLGTHMNLVWPVALILVGAWMLYGAIRPSGKLGS